MPPRGYRTGEDRTCEICGASFYLYPSETRNKAGRFCSMKCRGVAYRGEGNPKWRGGRTTSGTGYVYTYAPDHPNATEAGYVMEHRLVIEAAIGRHLEPHEEVHHRNHVRDDNRLENLQLTSGVAEHRSIHSGRSDVPCAHCGAAVSRTHAQRERFEHVYCSRTCAALAGSEKASRRARAATHCGRGHSLEDAYTRPDGRKRCRTCALNARRRRRAEAAR